MRGSQEDSNLWSFTAHIPQLFNFEDAIIDHARRAPRGLEIHKLEGWKDRRKDFYQANFPN